MLETHSCNVISCYCCSAHSCARASRRFAIIYFVKLKHLNIKFRSNKLVLVGKGNLNAPNALIFSEFPRGKKVYTATNV